MMALLATSSFASKVIEDSRSRYVVEDKVYESGVVGCESGSVNEGKFQPEGAHYLDGNGVPFRYYRVALPSKEMPTVSVSDINTVKLGKNYCKEDSLKFLPVSATTPVLKDGLWVTDVRVPLYVKQGASVALRKEFKLQVNFNGSASGVNPGKRALFRVENQAGASRFGVSQSALRKSLRKSAANKTAGVTFLTQILVGDKDIATFEEDGIYAIDYKTLRNSLVQYQRQEELDGIDVSKICLYGASPDTLADMGPGEAARNPNQLFEIPIEIRDHSAGGKSAPDGIFGEGDSLVFVGYGNAFWKRCDREDPYFANGKMDYFHSYSPYSYYQHFLLGWKSNGKGLRLSEKVNAPSASGKDVSWMRYVRAEKDAILRDTYYGRALNWEVASGKEWFWLWHSRNSVTHVPSSVLNTAETETLPGLVSDGDQYVSVSYFPYRSVWSSGALDSGDQVHDMSLSGRSYFERMDSIRFSFEVNGTSTQKSATNLIPGGNFRIDNPGLKASGNNYSLDMLPNNVQYDRFDGYTVAYQWNPEVETAEWLLPGSVSGVIRIPVESGVQVMKFKNDVQVGLLSVKDGFAKDSVSSDDDVRYLAYRENKLRSAVKVVGLPKPHANVLTDLTAPHSKMEYLIIAPEEFLDQAVALAEFRSNGEAVTTIPTTVVAVEDIYRRYTAGRLSPVAIRNYISYAYSVCPNLKFVLLAGAGNFDYRASNSKLTQSFIPPFEKEDAVVEDFFAALDSGEVVLYGNYDIDLTVGRLPVLSTSEFDIYLQKIKDYEKLGVMDNSDWRSSLLFAADDAKNSGNVDNSKHALIQESLARTVDSLAATKKQRWKMNKIYLLDYEEDAAAQKKEATNDFINMLNQGSLISLYIGHGSKTDWASEGLLKASYVGRLNNKSRYTILGSFSCTVGRFDEGNTRSLSEEFMVAPNAGSIASIGATRETFKDGNTTLAKTFLVNSLGGKYRTLGESFFKSKGVFGRFYSGDRYNAEKYVLIGEPVVMMPQADLAVNLDQKLDSLKALDKMTLSGTVEGLQDGYIDLVITEGRAEKRTDLQVARKDTIIIVNGDSTRKTLMDTVDVAHDGSLIYSEEVPVKNGRFMTEFITPRKISVGDTAAELRAWAYASNNPKVGRLWKNGIVISGFSTYADSLNDTIPPTIRVQPCNNSGVATDFNFAQVVKLQSPGCLQVVVEDSTALDFREQADEGISFEVVGIQEPFHPWPYLEQTSKKAKARYSFAADQYPAGKYVFKVRAMDVVGNVSSTTVNVEITDDMVAGLADVFNAPNPVGKKGTTFYFKNLAVNRDSKVNIYIYNQNGKLVQVLKDAVSGVTHWNGKDMHGRMLANGLYHYVVRSEVPAAGSFGKKTWTKKQKLLISR